MPIVNRKTCVLCRYEKHRSEFYASSTREDGLNNYCKSCCKVNRALEGVRKRDKKSKLSVRQRMRAIDLQIEYDADITLAAIFKRDLGICYLCGKWVPPGKASMEHRVPLSRGGTHVWRNVRLSHIKCNLRKGPRDAKPAKGRSKITWGR